MATDAVRRRGDELIALLANGDEVARLSGQELGAATNELLDLLFTGFPVGRVSFLLESDEDGAPASGLWLVSELGDRAAPLIPALTNLLGRRHEAWGIARMAAGDLARLAEGADLRTVSRLLELLSERSDLRQETDSEVFACAIDVLSRVPRADLERLAAMTRGRVHESLSWMASLEGTETSISEVESRLRHGDTMEISFAAAASSDVPELLAVAAESPLPFVEDFARTRLGWGRRGSRRWNLRDPD